MTKRYVYSKPSAQILKLYLQKVKSLTFNMIKLNSLKPDAVRKHFFTLILMLTIAGSHMGL
jgi:hypothetical protein